MWTSFFSLFFFVHTCGFFVRMRGFIRPHMWIKKKIKNKIRPHVWIICPHKWMKFEKVFFKFRPLAWIFCPHMRMNCHFFEIHIFFLCGQSFVHMFGRKIHACGWNSSTDADENSSTRCFELLAGFQLWIVNKCVRW